LCDFTGQDKKSWMAAGHFLVQNLLNEEKP